MLTKHKMNGCRIEVFTHLTMVCAVRDVGVIGLMVHPAQCLGPGVMVAGHAC